jgi:hypothetical protein
MKPVMGYPSQTAAIRALKAQGMGCRNRAPAGHEAEGRHLSGDYCHEA